jgi:hypothetical protein
MTTDCIRDEGLQDDKMEVLYGEADRETRARVETHLSGCLACREEMAALGRVRRELAAWTLDVPSAPRLRSAWRAWPLRLAAAAALVASLAAGLALHAQASLRQALAEQEARAVARDESRQTEIAALRAALDEGRASSPSVAALVAGFDERLDARIRESEGRQRQSLAEWAARAEAQRRMDLARVATGLSYLDGRHGRQLARTNQLMGYVLEAAARER